MGSFVYDDDDNQCVRYAMRCWIPFSGKTKIYLSSNRIQNARAEHHYLEHFCFVTDLYLPVFTLNVDCSFFSFSLSLCLSFPFAALVLCWSYFFVKIYCYDESHLWMKLFSIHCAKLKLPRPNMLSFLCGCFKWNSLQRVREWERSAREKKTIHMIYHALCTIHSIKP